MLVMEVPTFAFHNIMLVIMNKIVETQIPPISYKILLCE